LIPSKKLPLIIGHRGASAVAPENTLAAFARAFEDGANGIELDVRLARDGVPVVIHDPSLVHTGLRKARVSKFTSDRLSQIDVGSWFNRSHRRLARLQFTRQTVPTLDEVFRLITNQTGQDLICYVELKTVRKKRLNALLVDAVVEVISRYNFQSRVVVISFNLAAVAKVKELDSSIHTGALFGPRQRAVKSTRKIITATLECRADQILLHHLIAKRRLLALASEARLRPVVWTIDDRKWLKRAQTNDIHALMTNNPAKMLVR
jgi:glycerophosphoryl diester phosphodiesterase